MVWLRVPWTHVPRTCGRAWQWVTCVWWGPSKMKRKGNAWLIVSDADWDEVPAARLGRFKAQGRGQHWATKEHFLETLYLFLHKSLVSARLSSYVKEDMPVQSQLLARAGQFFSSTQTNFRFFAVRSNKFDIRALPMPRNGEYSFIICLFWSIWQMQSWWQ